MLILPYWVKGFICQTAIALAVGKIILKQITSSWVIPAQLHGNCGTYFSG